MNQQRCGTEFSSAFCQKKEKCFCILVEAANWVKSIKCFCFCQGNWFLLNVKSLGGDGFKLSNLVLNNWGILEIFIMIF